MTSPARRERDALADLLAARGPDAPTLCAGWAARDLAAHLVVRERRPDAAPGILLRPLAGYSARVQDSIAATPWPRLVELVRTGPPRWSPTALGPVDGLVNTVEMFVHHEDVRRADGGAPPRQLDPPLEQALGARLRTMARVLLRRAPVGVRLAAAGAEPFDAHRGEPMVTVAGPVGELVLFAYGRQAHAHVELDGPPEAVAALRAAALGL